MTSSSVKKATRGTWCEAMRRETVENTREMIQSGKLVPIKGRWKLRDVAGDKAPAGGRLTIISERRQVAHDAISDAQN